LLLWIQSDLHMELTRGWDLPAVADRPRYDLLVIAGDLIPRMERGVAWLLERVTDRPVLYVAGNHESYGADIDRTVEKARALAAGTNVHVMQNDVVQINDRTGSTVTTFLGATGWTDFNLFGDQERAMQIAGDVMHDYKKIRINAYQRRLRPIHTLARHRETRAFLQRELSKPKTGPRVIVSHMGLHPTAVRRGFERDISSAAYTSDCSDLLAMGVDVAIHGHTHETYDRMVAGAGTRLVTNAKGYGPRPGQPTWDNKDFDPNFVIKI
jgi:predicted phosphodiesterase